MASLSVSCFRMLLSKNVIYTVFCCYGLMHIDRMMGSSFLFPLVCLK